MGTAIERLFEQSPLTDIEVSERAGLPLTRVHAILEGRWLPSPGERKAMASALSVAVEDVDWAHTMAPRNVRYHRFGLPQDSPRNE